MDSELPLPKPATDETAVATSRQKSRKLVRGSSLMLVGRLTSVGVNFLVQVILVRALAKTEYGAFAVAMAVMSIGASVAVMGMGKTLECLAPLHYERREYREMASTILLVVLSVFGMGWLVTGALALGYGAWELGGKSDPLTTHLVLAISVLVPFEAMNHISEILFAVFAKPRELFVRRYVIGPGLKMAAVLSVFALGAGAHSLATAYVVASILEAVYSGLVLHVVLRRDGLWHYFPGALADLPWRRVLSSSLPLMLSDVLPTLRASLATLVLDRFHGPNLVAAFRAVFPVARLNHMVLDSFKPLFTPTISRMHAQNDRLAIGHAYWMSSVWVAVLSYPLFAACVVVPDLIATVLFGAKYSSSGPLLAAMSVGFYLSAVLGFARHVLRARERIAELFWTDVLTAVVSVALTLLLVPLAGAMGAALATSLTLVAGAAVNQWGLYRCRLLGPVDAATRWTFAIIGLTTVTLWVIQQVGQPTWPLALAMVVAGSLVVGGAAQALLGLTANFPEMSKLREKFWKRATRKSAQEVPVK